MTNRKEVSLTPLKPDALLGLAIVRGTSSVGFPAGLATQHLQPFPSRNKCASSDFLEAPDRCPD